MEVSLYLKRPDSKTDTVIYASISYGIGKPVKYYLPEKIHPQNWNKASYRARETRKFPEFPEFNARLDHIEVTIKNVIRKYMNDNGGLPPLPEKLKGLLDAEIKKIETRPNTHTLASYLQLIIAQSESGERVNGQTGKRITPGTIKHYKTSLQRIVDFTDYTGKKYPLHSIDQDFYKAFTAYLTTEKVLALNTIGKQVKTIKMVMKEAFSAGVTTNAAYSQFKAYSEDADTIYLNEKELEELAALDLEDSPRLMAVRDMFLVGCYTGLRFSDFIKFDHTNIENGFIEITQEKTAKPVVIPIHETVERIISKYGGVLPAPISNQKMNDYLSEVCGKVDCLKKTIRAARTQGGEKVITAAPKYKFVSTHTARRSFATNEYLAGTPVITIMAITGHKTEKDFLRYIRVTPAEHAKHLKTIWESRKLKTVTDEGE